MADDYREQHRGAHARASEQPSHSAASAAQGQPSARSRTPQARPQSAVGAHSRSVLPVRSRTPQAQAVPRANSQARPYAQVQGAPRPVSPAAGASPVRTVPTARNAHRGMPYASPANGSYTSTANGPYGRGPSSGMPAKLPAKKKGGLWKVVFWLSLVVFVVAIVALATIGFSYWQGQNRYDKLAEEVIDMPADIEGSTLASLAVDWDALRAVNPDIVGWIYVPGTIINYPIMYSGDDSTYLTRDFYGNEGGWWMADYGAVFLSGINKPDFSSTNNLVYGHNLLNGSMFADFAKLANQDEFDAHRTVYVLTPKGNYRLSTFAVVNVKATDPLAQAEFASNAEYEAYLQDKIDRSIVTPAEGAPDVAGITQTFAFSTCDHDHYNDMRYVTYCMVAEYAAVGSDGSEGSEILDVKDYDAAAAIDEASKEIA